MCKERNIGGKRTKKKKSAKNSMQSKKRKVLYRTRKTNKIVKTRKIQKGGNKEFIEQKIKESKEFIERTVKKIFPESGFKINCSNSMKDFHVSTKITEFPDMCVSFTIEYRIESIVLEDYTSLEDYYKKIPKIIIIELLNKCESSSGSNTLKKIEELARKLGATQINLEDASKIKACHTEINLALLDILATGESWYNTKGFYSENRETEKKNNSQILPRIVKDFIKDCIEVNREKGTLHLPELERILEIFNSGEHFAINDDMTVQEYFVNVKQDLKRVNDEECEKFIFASKLLDMIQKSKIIEYSSSAIQTKVII